MSDPIEINKKYRDLGEAEEFISYARLAGGDAEDYEIPGYGEGREDEISPQKKAQEEAEEILRQAIEKRDRVLTELEELKKKAYEEGFANGQAEGRQKGEEEYAGKISSALGLIDQLGEARKKLVKSYEAELLELIKVLVERLVEKEIKEDKQIIREVLNSALEYITENTSVSVKLNKEDMESLSSFEEGKEFVSGSRRIEFIEDNSISAGGCLVVTGSGEVDATLENRRDTLLAAIDKALKS